MTDQIQIWKAAAEAASKGPWVIKEGNILDANGNIVIGELPSLDLAGKPTYFTPSNDGKKFIALSRTAVPALCEALEREEWHRIAVDNRIAALLERLDEKRYDVPHNVGIVIAEAAADLRLLNKDTKARIDKILEVG